MVYSAALYKMMKHNSDSLYVAAAGNSGFSLDKPTRCSDVYPAMFDTPDMVCVGASTPDDAMWELEPTDCARASPGPGASTPAGRPFGRARAAPGA